MKTCRVPPPFAPSERSACARHGDGMRLLHAALVLSTLVLGACSEGTTVTSTVPSGGGTNVDPRTIIALHLSNTTSSIDDNEDDTDLIQVTGDLTDGRYPGRLVLADWKQDIRRGLTVDEFNQSAGGEGEEPEFDALVFLLPEGVSFKDGETINVFVSHDITAHGVPLTRSRAFSFVIRESGMDADALRVTATSPSPAARGVSLSPRVRATFNRNQELSGLANGMTLRGEQSGVHSEVESFFTQTTGFNVEITQRLAVGDAFLPGEVVEATWNSNLEDRDDIELIPHALRFQVDTGLVSGGWDASVALLDSLDAAPVKVLSADFLPETDGAEFVVVTTTSVELYQQTQQNVWTSSVFRIVREGRLAVVDAGLIDMDRDGVFEIVVLLGGAGGSRLLTFELDEAGDLIGQEDSVNLTAPNAFELLMADLDASGDPEVIVLHSGNGPAGSLSLLELTQIAPDPDSIDPLDPDSFTPRPGLVPVDNPIPGFTEASRVEAVDLDGNGHLDLVAQNTAGSLTLYRNLSSASSPFALRRTKDLSGREGGALEALAWTAVDVDSDFDMDLVVWDASGAILYENEQVVIAGTTVEGTDVLSGEVTAQPFPALDVSLGGPALAQALELDGDGFLDFVIARSDGSILLLLGERDDGGAFETVTLDGVGALPVNLVLADANGDGGQDLILAGGGSLEPVLQLSQGVERPPMPQPHSFRISASKSEEGDLLFIDVEGDIKERFAGYTLALDYDERVLTYERFDIPRHFETLATFNACPNEAGQGCAGSAAASMVYREETRGLPSDNIELGRFVFRLPTVEEDTTTEIHLQSFSDGGTDFDNSVTVVDEGATLVVPASLPLDPLSVPIEAPAPADLIVLCEVLERRSSDMEVGLSWESPAERSFVEFEVLAGGNLVLTLPGEARET